MEDFEGQFPPRGGGEYGLVSKGGGGVRELNWDLGMWLVKNALPIRTFICSVVVTTA